MKNEKPGQTYKTFFFVILLFITIPVFSARLIRVINTAGPENSSIKLISSDIEHSVVHFSIPEFSLRDVTTPAGNATIVELAKGSRMQAEGGPDLPKLTTSLVVPDNSSMEIRIISSSYKDFQNISIAPSKGIITRDKDPENFPYLYGKEYQQDAFYPGTLASMRDPYLLRDLCGQTLIVYPFQYNPVTKTLRVYYDITLEVLKTGETSTTQVKRGSAGISINKEFQSIYSRHFLNYRSISYIPLEEYGNILIISYGPFMNAMHSYLNWKRSIGYPTQLVSIDSVGNTPAQIKQYIADYYNAHGLTFVLLVGDNTQIPTYQGTETGGPSDNYYSYIVGNDHYADIFVGRFSAETVDQVNTQVQRTVDYEKNPQFRTDDWLTTVIGIGSDQGPGDNGEFDYEHIRNQQSELLASNYTSNPELFDGTQGGNDQSGNPTPSSVSAAVNEGASLILYCGHGSMTSWGTSGFNSSNVNALTNQGRLPFIWSVACVNGQFMNGTCFAETWLRATKSGQPTGALAFLGSTINQSWNSPMAGQDEMTKILSEAYPDNVKRTFGGISISGCMEMIDQYGADGSNMADTWMIFGDPSVIVRTKNPDTLSVSHEGSVPAGDSLLTIQCNKDGARATLVLHDSIISTGLVLNNTFTFTFSPDMNESDTLYLTVTNYNSIPYQSYVLINTPVDADFSATPAQVTTGSTVSFTDLSTGNPESWSWSFPGGTPSSSIEKNPFVVYTEKGTFDVKLVVSNGSTTDTILKKNYIDANYATGVENCTDITLGITPNPNNGIFKVFVGTCIPEKISLRIYNLMGSLVYEDYNFPPDDSSDGTLNISNLTNGMYLIKVKAGTQTITRKVLVER